MKIHWDETWCLCVFKIINYEFEVWIIRSEMIEL